MNQLEDLLQQCTVKLTISGRSWGTGFFVSPGSILTCAHVVDGAGESAIQVMWNSQENWARAVVVRSLPKPYDLALLKVDLPIDANPPCVYLSSEIQSRDPLYLFGYPDIGENGEPETFRYAGRTGDDPPIIKFGSGQVRPGMSGSPLLNQRTGAVCGIVQFTRDRSFDLGGGAIPTSVILAKFPELLEQQQSFHQQDQRWNNLDRGLGSIEQSITLQPHKKLFGATKIPPILKWIGRDELLIELNTDIANGRKVLVLHGQGGSGKTSLAVKLMEASNIDLSCETISTDCYYDNALYCHLSDSDSFDNLAEQFLKAFGMTTTCAGISSDRVIEIILMRLYEKKWLIVIDNLESLMELDSGKSISPDMGNLLNRLAYRGHNSQIIITSRRFPTDLNDRRGTNYDSNIIRAEEIRGISELDSIKLLEDLGMQDSEEDLKWIAEQVKGNVLVLGMLAKYSDKPGKLRQEPELVTDEATPIVKKQLEKQSAEAQELLARMCVLRIEMDATALTTLRLLQTDIGKVESTRESTKATERLLAGLVSCGLVETTYDKSSCKSHYVLHQLISETLEAIFKKDLGLERLWNYAARLYDSFEQPSNLHGLEDLKVILEKSHFYLLVERYAEITEIVINDVLPKLKQWGYWSLQKDWCDRILPHTTGKNYGICLRHLGSIHKKTGKWPEASHYLQLSLTHAKQEGSANCLATSLRMLGDIASHQGEYDRAKKLYQQSLELYIKLGNRIGIATSLARQGLIASKFGDYEGAEKLYQQSLKLYTEQGDRFGMATVLAEQGFMADKRGDYEGAEKLHQQSLDLRTELGNRDGMATSWGLLGFVASRQGKYLEAELLYDKSLNLHTELGNRVGIASSCSVLGDLASQKGDYDKAKELLQKSLELRIELGNRAGVAISWGVLGANELRRKDFSAAEICLKQALPVMEDLKMDWHIAQTNWGLAQVCHARSDNPQAQEHYSIAHDLFTKLGAKGDLENIEKGWI
jgi:tetratricopeptide (TPR) repeat protein